MIFQQIQKLFKIYSFLQKIKKFLKNDFSIKKQIFDNFLLINRIKQNLWKLINQQLINLLLII